MWRFCLFRCIDFPTTAWRKQLISRRFFSVLSKPEREFIPAFSDSLQRVAHPQGPTTWCLRTGFPDGAGGSQSRRRPGPGSGCPAVVPRPQRTPLVFAVLRSQRTPLSLVYLFLRLSWEEISLTAVCTDFPRRAAASAPAPRVFCKGCVSRHRRPPCPPSSSRPATNTDLQNEGGRLRSEEEEYSVPAPLWAGGSFCLCYR